MKQEAVNDYVTKAKVTVKELQKYDMIYVHIKGPDEFGHDGNALGKKQNIEKIDSDFFGTLLKELGIFKCGDSCFWRSFNSLYKKKSYR